jgi:hypothetical protein
MMGCFSPQAIFVILIVTQKVNFDFNFYTFIKLLYRVISDLIH